MTIEQLPSGSYRVTVSEKGVRYRVTFDHKPTDAEIVQGFADKVAQNTPSNAPQADFSPFNIVAEHFIDESEKALKSPATIRGYTSILRTISKEFKALDVMQITQQDIQQEVNNYSSTHSPKSTRNLYGFIHSVLAKIRPDFIYLIKLPAKQKKNVYEPSTKDIECILQRATGTDYELAFRLAVLGLRRGELLALTSADLSDDNVLTINKDVVIDKYNCPVIKERPKTSESNRRILIPDDVADMLRKKGYVYRGCAHNMNERLSSWLKELNIPKFNFHMFRHFAAAYLHQQGFTDQQIIAYCGWANSSNIMQRIYRYNLDPEQSQRTIADTFSRLNTGQFRGQIEPKKTDFERNSINNKKPTSPYFTMFNRKLAGVLIVDQTGVEPF